jgi:predicted CXXCH cytochrome family protein
MVAARHNRANADSPSPACGRGWRGKAETGGGWAKLLKALTRQGWRLATLSRKRERVVLLVLLAVLLSLPALAAEPSLPKASSGPCIADSATMRRDHPDMLKHQRDETLRQGIRGGKASLKDCVACHATHDTAGKWVPVNAPGQFCQSCHAYVAAAPDCFSCHATTPPTQEASR